MVVPSRKHRMMENIIKNQEREKEKLKGEIKLKEITPKEHKERIEILTKIGLLKKNKDN